MPHIVAQYRCHLCNDVIGLLTSNSSLLLGEPGKFFFVDPREIVLRTTLSLWCERCASQLGYEILLSMVCHECNKPMRLFYFPHLVMIEKPDRERRIVSAQRLITEYEGISFCSEECLHKKRPDIAVVPLEFRKASSA